MMCLPWITALRPLLTFCSNGAPVFLLESTTVATRNRATCLRSFATSSRYPRDWDDRPADKRRRGYDASDRPMSKKDSSSDESNNNKKSAKLVIYHKPVGVLSVMKDPWNRRTLNEIVCTHSSLLQYMHPVGRLDLDTSGLLLFSSDGKLTQRLLHPDHGIPRVYEGIVNGRVDHDALQQRLRYGVSTTDGVFTANLLCSRVFDTSEDLSYLNTLVREQGLLLQRSLEDDPTYHDTYDALSYVRLSVCEGKHRMVRRILHNAGYSVKLLHRRSYGNLSLSSKTETETDSESYSGRSVRDIWPPKCRIPVGQVEKVR